MKYILIFLLSLIICLNLSAIPVFAQDSDPAETPIQSDIKSGIDETQDKAGLLNWSVQSVIYAIINAVLSLLSALFVGLIIYGGFRYMASGGDEGKAKEARKILEYAIIGVIIIVFAWLIWGFVAGALGLGGNTIVDIE